MKNFTLLIMVGLLLGSLSGCATGSMSDSENQPGVSMNLVGARAGHR